MSLKKGKRYNSTVNQGYSCTFKQAEGVTWVSNHVSLFTVSRQVTQQELFLSLAQCGNVIMGRYRTPTGNMEKKKTVSQ